MSGYSEPGKQSPKKLHVLGYLVGDLVGIGAGVAVGIFFQYLWDKPWLTTLGGLVTTGVVAGAILLLVSYLAGTWEDDVAAYFGGSIQANMSASRKGKGYLKANRGLVKYILLCLITFGIYDIVVKSSISTDINLIAGRYDGKKTMHYCLIYFLLSGLTLGIAPLVWYHRLSARIGNELYRRGVAYNFGAGSFWGWNLLGLFIAIGPLVYMYKLFKAMNLLSAHYNVNG